jgi:DNA-binding MarR family transcriptional regulator
MALSQSDFQDLLQLRTGLRRFLRSSERHAEAAGMTPAQHQLLLAIMGHPDPAGPTVLDVAHYLVLRHHSAVGLIDRAVAAGLVKRRRDRRSRSSVRLSLTRAGIEKLDALVEAHREDLAHLGPTMRALWQATDRHAAGSPAGSSPAASEA